MLLPVNAPARSPVRAPPPPPSRCAAKGYGNVQIGEIPPNSTITLDIELLSIKTNPLGFRTKLVEG